MKKMVDIVDPQPDRPNVQLPEPDSVCPAYGISYEP